MSRAFSFLLRRDGCAHSACTLADTDVRESPLRVGGRIPHPNRVGGTIPHPIRGGYATYPPYFTRTLASVNTDFKFSQK